MKCRKRLYAVGLAGLLIVCFLTTSIYAFDLNDISKEVYDVLEKDEVITDIFRQMGGFLYGMLGTLLNLAEEGFTQIVKFDFFSTQNGNQIGTTLQQIFNNIDVILYSLLFAAFCIIVLIKTLQFENHLKTLYNVCLVMMVITMFGSLFTLMNDSKDALVDITGEIFKSGEDLTMADELFLKNTIDCQESLSQNKIVYLDELGFDADQLSYLDWNIRLSKDGDLGLNQYWDLQVENGVTQKEAINLADGLFGVGAVSYYRYVPNWNNINITCFVSVIIYCLAIFKAAYLSWQWVTFYLFGRIGVAKGMWDASHIGKALKQGLMTIGGFVILYAMMNLFSLIASSLMQSFGDNWVLCSILIFSIGMCIITGSGFVNDFLGIDDGSMSMLKNMFMANRLAKLGRGLFNAGAGTAGFVAGGMAKGVSNAADQMVHSSVDRVQEHMNLQDMTNESNENDNSFDQHMDESRANEEPQNYDSSSKNDFTAEDVRPEPMHSYADDQMMNEEMSKGNDFRASDMDSNTFDEQMNTDPQIHSFDQYSDSSDSLEQSFDSQRSSEKDSGDFSEISTKAYMGMETQASVDKELEKKTDTKNFDERRKSQTRTKETSEDDEDQILNMATKKGWDEDA